MVIHHQVSGVKGLYMVESVDSQKLATQLDKACEAAKRDVLQVMVQVNTSLEESKGGCEDTEAASVAKHIVDKCKNLKFTGLMTIGKLGDPNPEPYFAKLSQFFPPLLLRLSIFLSLLFPQNSRAVRRISAAYICKGK